MANSSFNVVNLSSLNGTNGLPYRVFHLYENSYYISDRKIQLQVFL